MMILQSSMSTLVMAFLTTSLLMILLTLFLCNTKLMLCAGYKLLAFFAIFVLLRFLFPFELPFTKNIYLPLSISELVSKLHDKFYILEKYQFSIWRIFKWVWGIGFVCGLMWHVLTYLLTRYRLVLYGKVITNQEPYRKIIEQICREQGKKNRFTVLEMPGLDVPVLFGIFSPHILIPENLDLPETNIYYLLRHEMAHHFHHDLILKLFIRFITLVYWWNPFCILLNRQTDTILEMHVDDSLTLMDIGSTKEYMQCLIDVKNRMTRRSPLPRSFTMSLLPAERSDIQKRFALLLNNQETRKQSLNILLCFITVFVYLLSYTFILEAYIKPTDIISPSQFYGGEFLRLSDESSYCIDNEDGTYDIYYNYEYFDTIDSLKSYPEDMPVYTKENCPY